MAQKKIWLRREIGHSENGHFQLEGSHGRDAVAVVLDPSITSALATGREAEEIIAMIDVIEASATRKFAAGEATRVHEYNSPEFRWWLIAITDEDLAQS